MPSFSRLLCTFVCSSIAVGCSASDAPLPEPEPEPEPKLVERLGELPVSQELVDAVCTPNNYVAVLASGTKCPKIGAWNETRVFADATFYATAEQATVPAEMARYCRYSWTGDNPPWQQIENHSAFTIAERDCRAVTLQSDPLSDALAPALRDNFHWLAGDVDATDLNSASSEQFRAPVTVALVDGLPHAEPTDVTSNHGPVMKAVIEDIACPDATCAVEVSPHLGLPRTEDGVDFVHGGYIGLYYDLARGIYRATEAWREAKDKGETSHLVINLSVGWEAAAFGDLGSSPGVNAVHMAIERARCLGAIPVVAAGNSSGLFCNETALAPALWEELPRPDLNRCADLGLTTSAVQDAPGGYSPLVYSLGGLQSPSESMTGTRNDGKPRLFAPASHVVAGDAMTASGTGTSFAAATGSGAAALLWSYRPDLAPNEVMQVLYGQGVGTTATADYGLSGGGAPIRRLDVCQAMKAACDGPANCPGVPVLACTGAQPYTADDLFAIADSLDHKRDYPKFSGAPAMCNNACGLDSPLRVQNGVAQNCAGVELDPTLFLTRPQPPEPGCQDCTLADDFAALSVSEERSTAPLVGVTVSVLDEITGRDYLFELDPASVSYGSVAEIELPLGNIVPQSAHAHFQFADPDDDTRDVMIVR